MEYYAFKGPGNETAMCAVEEYDDEYNCWKCQYFIRFKDCSCVLWKALPAVLWSIEYELTKEDNVYVLRMYLSDVLSVFKLNIQATQLPGNAIFEYRFNFSEYRIETDYTIDIHYIMNNRVYDESRYKYK